MKDVFEIWKPIGEFAKNKYLEGFNDDYDGLKILLKGIKEGDKVLRITFKTYFAFRTSNESYRLKALYEDEFSNGINFSHDSKFLRWIKEESRGIYDERNLIHYLICSNDDITEVISAEEPSCEWI